MLTLSIHIIHFNLIYNVVDLYVLLVMREKKV